MKPGLERIAGLLELLADPQDAYPIIHVTGTNGKTSTARMAATLLSAHGLTPGLFTSPHLHYVEERYEYGLAPMSDTEFAEEMTVLAPIVDMFEDRSGDLVTYFELTAALAFSWFASRSVDAAVVETGLGGRLDATNAARSDVAVVTSIALEHTEYLGNTLAAIAGEKLAILDEGSALVTGDLPGEALEVAARVAAEREALWFKWGADIAPTDLRPTPAGWVFDLRSPMSEYHDVEIRLHGRHQVANFAMAVAAVEALFGRALDEAGVREAASMATSPGRMEQIRLDPLVVVDGAHNPEAMEALSAALREEFPSQTWELVMGVMRDKDIGAMLDALHGLVRRAHVAAADAERATPAADLASTVAERLDVETMAYESVAAATAAAVATGAPVLVTGSIYVVGEARRALGE